MITATLVTAATVQATMAVILAWMAWRTTVAAEATAHAAQRQADAAERMAPEATLSAIASYTNAMAMAVAPLVGQLQKKGHHGEASTLLNAAANLASHREHVRQDGDKPAIQAYQEALEAALRALGDTKAWQKGLR